MTLFSIRRAGLVTIAGVLMIGLTDPAAAQAPEAAGWVAESNAHTQVLLGVLARHAPEAAGQLGVDGLDEEILDLKPGFTERNVAALETARTELAARLADAPEGPVRQDLEILLRNVDDELEGVRLSETHLLPYFDIASVVYGGIRALLEDRIPPERRRAALTRLQRYTGIAEGYTAVADLAEAYLREEWTNRPDRIAPFRGEVERNLGTSRSYVEEIGSLFEHYDLEGYEPAYEALQEQVEAYDAFVRDFVLPRARDSFRLPEEVYAFRLREFGVDLSVDELQRRAQVAFEELQNQLQALAFRIAEARNLPSADYRDVIRALKTEQFEGEDILPHYETRMDSIEAIIAREGIVSLPERDLRIRLATEAESAASPAPFMSPPRLIGNTGEFGEFVLPLRVAGGAEGTVLDSDDFMHEAASWPLAAHEGRPGHELQYASMVERGVSQARVIFAFNSVNVEGWALYMEEQMLPYLPIEGQFMTLWSRLVRSARAYLDPALNLGTITREEAERVLREEVLLSEALTRSELERYTFRAPGQATSYFNGYLRLMELRAETELRLGDRFDKQAFHDFILSQGLLPPALVRRAVLDTFVPAQHEG